MYRARFVRPEPGVFAIDFDRAIDDRPARQSSVCTPDAGLAVDVWEENDTLMLQAAVPGLTAEALEITLRDTRLVLRADAPEATPGRTYLLQERRPVGFERRLRLPYPVDVEATNAVIRDGILTLSMPKAAVARAHRVQIRTEEVPSAVSEVGAE